MSSRAPLWKPHWYMRAIWWLRNRWIAVLLSCSTVIGFYLPAWLSNHGHRVPGGVFVAVMGLVAAIMAFHKEPTRGEKALWIMCLTALMVAEIRNLYVSDREQANKFDVISGSLDASAKGLKATADGMTIANIGRQREFDATTSRMQAAAKSQKETFDWISGGQARAHFMVNPRTMLLEYSTEGPQPLREVYITIDTIIMDKSEGFPTMKEDHVLIGTIYPHMLWKSAYHVPVAGDSVSVAIRIYQLNGIFYESFNLEKKNGVWTVPETGSSNGKNKKRLIPKRRPALSP